MRLSRLIVRLFAVAGCVLGAALVVAAQRGGGAGAPAAPPLVPVTASSLAAYPSGYVGRNVTMMGVVAQQLSPTTFTVDEGPATTLALPVLVIAPTLTGPAPAKAYVTVIGAAVLFEPDDRTALKGAALDLPADVAAKYRGHAAVIATGVITADLTDLAKKKPVPMTPEEQAFSEVMKKISPASTALRTGVGASDAGAAHDRAAELKALFTTAQAFFKKRGIPEAEGWAGEAITLSDSVSAAAAASKWPEATAAAGSLTQFCTTCHNAHRERLDDGTYRLKTAR